MQTIKNLTSNEIVLPTFHRIQADATIQLPENLCACAQNAGYLKSLVAAGTVSITDAPREQRSSKKAAKQPVGDDA